MVVAGFASPAYLDRAAMVVAHPYPSKCGSMVGRNAASIRRRCRMSMKTKTTPSAAHKLLILGGTGRVGGKAAEFLASQSVMPLEITLAGRNVAQGQRLCDALATRYEEREDISFAVTKVDVTDADELAAAIENCDTVLHTAGPFQRRDKPGEVASAAISIGRNYVDVCDDTEHARHCKSMDALAKEKRVSCWICTGIYPGVSNLMAAQCVAANPKHRPNSIRFSYYTAGTGGIGSTVLASTFLLLSEDVKTYRGAGGQAVIRPPASDLETVDFGGRVGKKDVFLLNLPEVESIHDTLCAGEVLAKFATGPPIWNWLLRATAQLVPRDVLRNTRLMRSFSAFSLPVVRAVDVLSGARTAIRVDVDFDADDNGESCPSSCAIYEHNSLQDCVGAATAAFALKMIEGVDASPGVWYPEEVAQSSSSLAESVLSISAMTADSFAVRKIQ